MQGVERERKAGRRRAQGAVEYIIILGVIILIALIVVNSIGNLGIFQFSSTAQVRSTEISNLLADVAFSYVVTECGNVQVSIKSTTYKRVIANEMYWYDALGNTICTVNMGDTTLRQSYERFTNTCTELAGTAGNNYEYSCTLRYTDSNNIDHAILGLCEGFWEENVPDTTAPLINHVRNVSTTSTESFINWSTNENANSSVNYGTTIALGSFNGSNDMVLNHSILITGLSSNTLYYYNITSCDNTCGSVPNCNTTGPKSFTTD